MRKNTDRDTAIYVAFEEYEPNLAPAEISLIKAILITALADLEKAGLEGRRAREYFLSDEEEYLFSFQSICDFLDLDAQKVREGLGLER